MAKAGDECPRKCGGKLVLNNERGNKELICHSCQRSAGPPESPSTKKKKGEIIPKRVYRQSKGILFYEAHLKEIKEDYVNIRSLNEILDKWSMPMSVWKQIKDKVIALSVSSVEKENSTPELNQVSIEEILSTMSDEEKKQFYEITHKADIIADAAVMTVSQVRTKWCMSKDKWLKLRHLWNLPVASSCASKAGLNYRQSGLVSLIDQELENYLTIEEFKAWWAGYKSGKGWTSSADSENGKISDGVSYAD